MHAKLKKRINDAERAILDGRVSLPRKRLKAAPAPLEQRSLGHSNRFGPTPEQKTKSPYGFEGETVIPGAGPVEPVKRHKMRTTVDRYKRYFTEPEIQAFGRFILDSERATSYNITSNWGDAGGGSSGARSGGVIDINRMSFNRVNEIRRVVPVECWEILHYLVLAVRNEKIDRALTIHEVAQSHAPHLRSKDSLTPFGAALMKATAWVLRDAYDKIDRGTHPDSKAMLQIWQERRAIASAQTTTL